MNLLVELAGNYLCPLVIFFAHELHECEHYGLWALVLWRSAFQAHQPSLPIRGLRPRLLSLRSVLPSRHSSSTKSFAHEFHELTRIVCNE